MGQLLLSPSRAELGEPGKRQMASSEVVSYCPSVVILSICCKKRIKNESRYWQCQSRLPSGSSLQGQVLTGITVSPLGERMWNGGVTGAAPTVDLQLYLPGLDSRPPGKL